jgi:F-type H+-transporting ATPase subunit b
VSNGKRILAASAGIASAWVARPALAAGGGIEILPDWTGLLPILLVLFALLIFPVNRLIFVPLFRVLDEREQRIDGARARALQVDGEAEQVLSRYADAVAQARAEAAGERKTRLDGARAEEKQETSGARAAAEAEIDRARGELDAALEQARRGLRPEAEALAREAAARILGRELS